MKKYRKKEYVHNRVKFGCADKLFDLIWREKKVYCPLTFKSAYVNVNKSIIFKGMCSECEAVIVGTTHCDHSRLTVDITNYNADFVHSKRRHLKGANREKLAAQLKDKTAFNVHREIAGELIVDGDKRVPPQMPKIKSYIETILNWKNSNVAYSKIIFDVSISPFYVNYHLPIQREFYLSESRNNKMAISVDVTGSVIKPPLCSEISPKSQKLRHVFFYRNMLKTNGASIPIFQKISEKHSARFISYWLGECFYK